MYQVIIQFKKDLPEETLHDMKNICDKEFDNRAGRVIRSKNSDNYRLVYEGEEDCFCCLQLGAVMLNRVKGFKDCVSQFEWIDEEPEESHSIFEALATPVYIKGKCVNA